MKAVILLLLLVSVSLGFTPEGEFSFSTQLLGGKRKQAVLAKVFIKKAFSEEKVVGDLFSLFVEDVMFKDEAAEEDKFSSSSSSSFLPVPQDFSLPFQFLQFPEGEIRHVRTHPEETLEVKNLKKSIVEALQTNLLADSKTQAVEAGSLGVRKVWYERKEGSLSSVSSSFSLHDFVSFPEGSNLEKGKVKIHGSKTTSFLEDSSFSLSRAELKIDSFQTRSHYTSLTELRFLSSDVMFTEVIQEADWVIEDLVHEIEKKAESLKERLPSLLSLFKTLSQKDSSFEEASKSRAQLIALMNSDEESLSKGLEFLSAGMETSSLSELSLLSTTLARVKDQAAQKILASQIVKASEAQQWERLVVLLKSLVGISNPSNPKEILNSLLRIQVKEELKELLDLSIGTMAHFLPRSEADDLLSLFVQRLQKADQDPVKVHNILVLGNAGDNVPVEVLLHYLTDSSPNVRGAALVSLRDHLQKEKVEEMVSQVAMTETEPVVVSSLATSLKQGLSKHKRHFRGGKLHKALKGLWKENRGGAQKQQGLEEVMEELEGKKMEKSFAGSTEIWNDTSDPLYNLVAPAAERQRDVDRFPNYTGFISAQQFGPNISNLKAISGVFSGTKGKGCLAGDFKVFTKFYSEIRLGREVNPLVDLQLYVFNMGNYFESRVYAIIAGRTVVDFSFGKECSEDRFLIFDGEIEILSLETEIPLDIGKMILHADVIAGMTFDAGYKICLLGASPFVELFLTGEIYSTVDTGATVTVIGVLRGGIEGKVYLNYRVGPDTQLGSRNSTSGELVCEACIGIYYGYNPQIAYLGGWVQRRQGLGWGPKETFPLSEWSLPPVPFPSPLVEACSLTSSSSSSSSSLPHSSSSSSSSSSSPPEFLRDSAHFLGH